MKRTGNKRQKQRKIKVNPKNNSLNPYIIEKTDLYNLVKELTTIANFSSRDKYEKCWEDFYLPLKRSEREISLPFSIIKYRERFLLPLFSTGQLMYKEGE